MMLTEGVPVHRASWPVPHALPAMAAGRGPVRAVVGVLAWLLVILAVGVAALWLWQTGLPAVAWSVAVTAVVVVPAALAGAAAAGRDLRRSAPAANAPADGPDRLDALVATAGRLDRAEDPSCLLSARLADGARAVACTGRAGALLALWDGDGRLVHEHPGLAVARRR